MRNLKALMALVATAAGSAFVATFQVSDPQVITASTATVGASVVSDGSGAVAGVTSPTSTAPATSAPTSVAVSATAAPTTTATGTATVTTSAVATPSPTPIAATSTAAAATATTTATWADGTYTGSAVHEPWGTFQVEATIAGGKLISITVVASPSDGHSSRINSAAVPLLTQSALAAQSAEIDTVSGATWTSQSYATSLQAALDAARAAATTSQIAG